MAYYKIKTEDGTVTKLVANNVKVAKQIIIEIVTSPLETIQEISHKEFHGNRNNN